MATTPFEATISITVAALTAPSSAESSILSSQCEVTEFMTVVFDKCCELQQKELAK